MEDELFIIYSLYLIFISYFGFISVSYTHLDVYKRQLKYNANRAMENLGYDNRLEVDPVNPIVLNGLSTETKTHDFFSTKGNGYQKGVYESLQDSDFVFDREI